MRLIIDTNRIIAALLKDGTSRKIITTTSIEFYSLDYVNDEIDKYMDYIIKKSGIKKEDIELLLAIFMQTINLIPEEKIKSKMEESLNIMRDIDAKDAPIVAGALSFENEGIWSDDNHLKKQNKIKVWKTKDLIKFL